MNKPFKSRFNAPRLTPEEAERQGRISRLAFARLGRDGAIAFLNTHDDTLGGRPIDLAVQGVESCATVEAALNAATATETAPGSR
ncbi:hypothetical protein [Sphingomonas sanxanigenens]|uniref:Antitoxin Xre/MbcA/ParS-like toxin-binding domain-containing protein n=1 Tax=Sphingomonas sanxanigenens DSM 19645 = NX02 TaxID=1123269 RepID=W0A339_9SPHN|nr:hypothetical protein [Sphingomonas sanxanigenens]AHE52364.1 hypothetical protein NX02_03035 [Sphingomonas sanxanigenens DSM 19645 = NX02]